ncbi:MAG: hypothetical protein AAF657_25535, partial [Acidobacteriota bacterium]
MRHVTRPVEILPLQLLVLIVAPVLATIAARPVGAAEPVERLEIVDRAIAYHGGELYRTTATELDLCSKSGCFDI